MTRFSLLAILAVIILALAFAGCGGGGGGGGSTPDDGGLEPPPVIDDGSGDPGDDDNIPGDPFTVKFITGKIVNESGIGVQGVKVVFTNKAALANTYTATSQSGGSFQIALNGVSVLSLFDSPFEFKVDTTAVKATYPTTEKVTYGGDPYDPSHVPVPIDVLQMESGNLGVIVIKSAIPSDGDDGGGNTPPGTPVG